MHIIGCYLTENFDYVLVRYTVRRRARERPERFQTPWINLGMRSELRWCLGLPLKLKLAIYNPQQNDPRRGKQQVRMLR